MQHQYFIIYKPYHVLSQFTSQENKKTLSHFFHEAKDVYPVGRLDYDSEGLLILTNDVALNHRLLHPKFAHEREYFVQLDGAVSLTAIKLLGKGVEINIDGKLYKTKPCKAFLLKEDPNVEERNPPIRYRKEIPATWIKLILTEGKNRQVRKMTAKVGFPTLRLIRTRIEQLELNNMKPGDILQLPKKTIYERLFKE